jgi:hydrogenase-4 transcriptional activator
VLTDYRWPGNVREMSAVIDRAVLLGQGQTLDVAAALGRGVTARTASSASPSQATSRETALVPLDEAIKRHIEAALAHTRGRVEGAQGAARVLRVNPHTLRARMRKLGIDWATYRHPIDPA